MTNTEQAIARILERLYSKSAAHIRSEIAINKELGIDGDDAVDLLREIQNQFEIDIKDFEFSKYFGPESVSFLTAISRALRGDRLNLQPLSVRQLAEYVDKKAQLTPSPRDEGPSRFRG
jgi:acyl carrier protein